MQRFSKLVSLLIYPILYTVPTGGLLYLTTSSASAWLTFRLLPFLQHTLYGQPGTSIATTATPIKHAEHASNVSTTSSTPPRQENATLASSLMSSGSNGHHGSDSATVTVSESSLAELQSCTDVEKLLEHSILHHAKKHTRAPSPLSPLHQSCLAMLSCCTHCMPLFLRIATGAFVLGVCCVRACLCCMVQTWGFVWGT